MFPTLWKGLNHEQVQNSTLSTCITFPHLSSLSLSLLYLYVFSFFLDSLHISLYSCPCTFSSLLSSLKVQQLIQLVYGKSIVSVDWRRLVLCLAQPYPLPTTEDLLTTLTSMRASVDVKKERLISRDAYMSVQLWLDDRSEEERDTRLKSVRESVYHVNAHTHTCMYSLYLKSYFEIELNVLCCV